MQGFRIEAVVVLLWSRPPPDSKCWELVLLRSENWI